MTYVDGKNEKDLICFQKTDLENAKIMKSALLRKPRSNFHVV